MATLTIRDLDDEAKAQLRVVAARHGRSMEAEARAVLEEKFMPAKQSGLGIRIQALFADLGEELEIPPREDYPREVDFEA